MHPTVLKHDKDALSINATLQNYRINSVLGRGGFGLTYLATEVDLDRRVAIKEYFPQDFSRRDNETQDVTWLTEDDRDLFEYGRDSFLEEAKTLVKFRHPNIVRVLSFFRSNQTAYLVMEYEEGVDFQTYLDKQGPMSQDALVRMLKPICEGLAQVHETGFIHRDIKPANIFIRADGSSVLLDFGASRDIVNRQAKDLTRILAPAYAPYEQEYPEWKDQGPWTDIFALGSTLYRAVSGEKPISAKDRAKAILFSKKEDPYIPLSSLGIQGFDPRFLAAIDQALAFDPEERPITITEWVALWGESEQAPAPSTAAGKRSQPVLGWSVGVFVLLALTAGGYFFLQKDNTAPETPAVDRDTQERGAEANIQAESTTETVKIPPLPPKPEDLFPDCNIKQPQIGFSLKQSLNYLGEAAQNAALIMQTQKTINRIRNNSASSTRTAFIAQLESELEGVQAKLNTKIGLYHEQMTSLQRCNPQWLLAELSLLSDNTGEHRVALVDLVEHQINAPVQTLESIHHDVQKIASNMLLNQ